MKALSLLTAIALSGCVTQMSPYIGDPVPQACVDRGRDIGALVIRVTPDQIAHYCGTSNRGDIIACAQQHTTLGIWRIFTTTDDRAVMDHEYGHVGGCDHD